MKEENMDELNFNSQICTSREQSERLLALGLKPETADVTIHCEFGDTYIFGVNYCQYVESHRRNGHKEEFFKHTFPAWSLGRLLEMLADRSQEYYMEKYPYRSQEYYMVFIQEAYDDIISCIESQIKEGYFNKEYLEV